MSEFLELLQGRIVYAGPKADGSTVTADVAIGDEVLEVAQTGDFDAEGGMVVLGVDGPVVEYVAVDDDLLTVTLAAGSPVALGENETVAIYDPVVGGTVVEYVALVLTDEQDPDDQPIEVSIQHGLATKLEAAVRSGAAETVTLVRDGEDDYMIWQIDGKQAVDFQLEAAVTDLAAGIFPDVEPPTGSPAITVTGMPSGLVIAAEQVAPSTLITYHIGTTADFVPDGTTASGPATHSTVHVANTLPDGAPFVADTTYYARTVASNTAGEAPPSDAVEGRLDLDAVATLVAAQLVAGFIVTGSIQIGAMTIDADSGFDIPSILNIPVNGIDVPKLLAFIIAVGMTIRDNLNVFGFAQLFGRFVAANGITDPRVKARLSSDWPVQTIIDITGNPVGSTLYRGFAWDSAVDQWVAGFYFYGPGIHRIDPATGAVVSSLGFTGSHVGPNFAVYSYTYLAGAHYFLGYDADRSNRRYVYAFDGSGAKAGEWEYTSEPTSPHAPTLGNDGTDLVIAQCGATDVVRVRRFDPTNGTIRSGSVTTVHAPGVDLTGVYWGSADFGATRIVVSHLGGFYVYDTTGARQTAQEWNRAGATYVRVFGWDGGQFAHMDASGRLWCYPSGHPTSSMVYGGYTWVDSDTTGGSDPHETAVSPAQSFTWPARSRLNVSADSAPDAGVDDPSLHDLANQTAIYVGTSAVAMRFQALLDVGVDSWAQEAPLDTASAVAPTVTSFDTAGVTPGSYESAADDGSGVPLWYARGDGTFRAMKSKQTAVRVMGPFSGTGSANEETATITFPVEFDSTPSVLVWAHGDPTTFICWASGVSTTGFTLHAYRVTGTGSFTASWSAENRTS